MKQSHALATISLVAITLALHAASAQQPTQLAQADPAQAQPQQPPTPQQRVAMLRQWLQASQAQLRHYEWIETTSIRKGGEEKGREQKQCYYGVDGSLQKLPIGDSGQQQSGGPPGLLPPGRLIKKAKQQGKEDLVEYMQAAANLVHSYVPPDPARIDQAINSGHFAASPQDGGRRARLEFRDYLKPNDLLSVDIEVQTNRLVGMHVSSYLEKADDAVTLDVAMGVLPDGTIYTAKTTLNAPAKDIVVSIDNAGHRPTGR